MMQSNPIAMLMQAMRGNQNPMGMLQQMAMSNPQARQAMQIMRGKDPQQLRGALENMARERGTTLEQVARQMGIPFR